MSFDQRRIPNSISDFLSFNNVASMKSAAEMKNQKYLNIAKKK